MEAAGPLRRRWCATEQHPSRLPIARPADPVSAAVVAGQELGDVLDLFGGVTESPRAAIGGMLVALRCRPRVDPGELVAVRILRALSSCIRFTDLCAQVVVD